MIERVRLTDFQLHRELDLPLGPVTTLVGPSDRGKSAVLRAVRWAATNAPAGASFVRDGAAGCRVALKVDGRWVVRSRTAKENVYEFDGDVYRALKPASVPDAIAAHLNAHPAAFQGQLDSPFWLTDTAGEVARALNQVVNLQAIDDVSARAAADLRAARAEASVAESRLAEAKARAESTEWAVAAKAELDAIVAQADAAAAAKRECDRLRAEIARAEDAAARRDALAAAVQAADAVLAVGDAAAAAAEQIASLRRLIDAAELAEREAAAWAAVEGDWSLLCDVRQAGDDAAKARGELSLLVADVERGERECAELERQAAEAEAELAAATGGRCPLCGQTAAPSQFCSPTSTSPTESPSLAVRRPVRSGTPRRSAT